MKKKQRQQRRKKAKRNEEERKETQLVKNGRAIQQHMTPVSNLRKKKTRAIIRGATNRSGSVIQKCPKNQ